MRVLLANKFFFRNGGSETVLFQERDFLRGRGVEVADFAMADPRNLPSETAEHFVRNVDYRANGGRLARLREAAGFVHSAEAVAKIEALADAFRPEIAHLHNIYHQLTPAIIPALRRKGVKVVLTLHDYKLVCPVYSMLRGGEVCEACRGRHFWRACRHRCQEGSLAKSLLLAVEAYWHRWWRSYEQVDLVLAPSRFLADLVSRDRLGPGRVRVIRNGIDTAGYAPSGEDGGYGLYFGRLSREKGVGTLLKAQEGGGGLPLKVVGTGPLLDELRARHPGVEFTGYKCGEELRALVRRSSYVVVPSEWYENCSMVVLEAMAFGKPVIGARIGGIPEQVEHGATGLLFTSGDVGELAACMTELARDPGRRRTLGEAGRAKLEGEYSLKDHCEQLMQAYRDVLDGGRGATWKAA